MLIDLDQFGPSPRQGCMKKRKRIFFCHTVHSRHMDMGNIRSESRYQCLLGDHDGLGKECISVVEL